MILDISEKNRIEHESLVLDYLHRFGNAAALGLLHPLCKIFQPDGLDGIIGYRLERNCAVVLGDPVCAPADRLALAKSFHEFCKDQKHRNIYVMASETFTNDVLHHFGGSAIQIGHEIMIDPSVDTRTLTGPYPRRLRHKEQQAMAYGVSIGEYKGGNPEIEQTFIAIAEHWLKNRKGPQIFLLPIDIFAHRDSKRWFYAQKDGKIIGFLMLNAMSGKQIWVLNGSIMLTEQAPNGTSEYLMLYILETLRNEGSTLFSVGTTPSMEIERIEGFGRLTRLLLTGVIKSAHSIFKIQDRQLFWKKFLPRKEPTFITHLAGRMGIREIRALLRALHVNI